jgi:class 3 adenylate cyclase
MAHVARLSPDLSRRRDLLEPGYDRSYRRLGPWPVVETQADEFFAVFEAPASALDIAVSVQRVLRGRAWVDDLEIRVRVGIHSGYPTTRAEANYIGMAVHGGAHL